MGVTPRRLRIRMSHQIGNRRFTATRFRKPSPERVTQIVPMQIVDPSQLTSRRECSPYDQRRGEVIRIISARTATSRERRDYERAKE